MIYPPAKVYFNNSSLTIEGDLLREQVEQLYITIFQNLQDINSFEYTIDLSGVKHIDAAGVVLLDSIIDNLKEKNTICTIKGASDSIQRIISIFSPEISSEKEKSEKTSFFEKIGSSLIRSGKNCLHYCYLIADASYYSITGLINRKGIRQGEFTNQCILIGMNALPIVALISFLIGFILALQSSAQLRQFGASIYVADLITISMVREMGPLMTAIILAGRSGSSIASEIATMVVTEETDALKSMALNPVRYILVPKIYAITLTSPMLTILSMLIGIMGSFVIGITYLDIPFRPFYNEVVNALFLKDILTGMLKSIIFAWIIVITGAFFGFQVKGGSEGVGRVTTAAVVASIFLVILADSILGLIFYFGQEIQI